MKWMHWLGRRTRLLREHRDVEAELSAELEHHIDLEAEDLVRQGWDARSAKREALRRFGGEERTKERVRDERGGRLLVDLEQDARYALRGLRRSPGFTLSAVLVLAIGVGASTAVFSTVRAVLLDPLPYDQPDRLVRVWAASPERGSLYDDISYPNFLDWADRTRTLSSLSAYTTFLPDWTLARDGQETQEVRTAWVAGDFFGAMDMRPLLGRTLSAEDLEAGRTSVVLSEGAWRRLFGADPSIVGRAITLEYRSFDVVGVMPAAFAYPEADVDVWVPLTTVDARGFPYPTLRGMRFAFMVGRLAEGRSMDDAQAELAGIATELEAAFPANNAGQNGATVRGLRDFLVRDVRVALWSLLGAVAFFLLLAAANIANLLIARGLGRQKELALRQSLGASSGRVTRQLLTEGGLLALLGGTGGAVLAAVLVRAVTVGAAGLLPRAAAVHLDSGALVASVLASTLVVSVAGVWPAVRGAGTASSLVSGTREIGASLRGVRTRRWLVAGEVGLAGVLLVGAGLLIQSFGALLRVDPGFRSEGVAAMTVNVPFARYAADQAWATRHQEILAQLRSTPGVEEAAGIGYLPVRSIGEGRYVRMPGIYDPPAEERAIIRVFPVTSRAFHVLGIPMMAGRDFGPSDGPEDPQVAVVNEAFVREILAGRAAVGAHFESDDVDFEIVGVVGDVRHVGLALPVPPTFYTHMLQSPRGRQSYVVRAGGDPSGAFALMRRAVEDVDPQLAVSDMLPLSTVLSEHRARSRVLAAVLGGLAGLALLLATLGVYGVLAYVVRGRLGEMGLRAALGASRGQIVYEVFSGGMRPAVVGLVMGLAGSALLSRYLESLLFEVRPLDLGTFAGGAAVLLVTAAAACTIPARWAATVDPARSLRAE